MSLLYLSGLSRCNPQGPPTRQPIPHKRGNQNSSQRSPLQLFGCFDDVISDLFLGLAVDKSDRLFETIGNLSIDEQTDKQFGRRVLFFDVLIKVLRAEAICEGDRIFVIRDDRFFCSLHIVIPSD